MTKRIELLIDGDWIVYAAGFAGQQKHYVSPTLLGDADYTSLTELKQDLEEAEEGASKSEPIYERIELDPPAHVFHSAKKMIEAQVDKVMAKFNPDSVRVTIYIDADGNFRSRLGTIRPYKGQRHPAARPLMYNDLRQYLLEAWKAEPVFDIEADDALTMALDAHRRDGQPAVLCGVDKDLLQCPGWHLNPNKGFRNVSETEGLERLYVQAAEGDSVDNIGGCYKVGKVRARKEFVGHGYTEAQMWRKLVELYDESIEKYGPDIYAGLAGERAALENMRLVYLLRSDDIDEDGKPKLWEPPA